ncbi:MAG: hypothetical protein J7L23_04900 [Candidatus Diapherotrites archaeon]|nr:hypothetical protein [Candidatus Diapherotrites archaeon]
MEKRRCLFTKYEFEIGVVTLPAHLVVLSVGIILFSTPIGKLVAVLSLVGALAAVNSLIHGAKEIKF